MTEPNLNRPVHYDIRAVTGVTRLACGIDNKIDACSTELPASSNNRNKVTCWFCQNKIAVLLNFGGDAIAMAVDSDVSQDTEHLRDVVELAVHESLNGHLKHTVANTVEKVMNDRLAAASYILGQDFVESNKVRKVIAGALNDALSEYSSTIAKNKDERLGDVTTALSATIKDAINDALDERPTVTVNNGVKDIYIDPAVFYKSLKAAETNGAVESLKERAARELANNTLIKANSIQPDLVKGVSLDFVEKLPKEWTVRRITPPSELIERLSKTSGLDQPAKVTTAEALIAAEDAILDKRVTPEFVKAYFNRMKG